MAVLKELLDLEAQVNEALKSSQGSQDTQEITDDEQTPRGSVSVRTSPPEVQALPAEPLRATPQGVSGMPEMGIPPGGDVGTTTVTPKVVNPDDPLTKLEAELLQAEVANGIATPQVNQDWSAMDYFNNYLGAANATIAKGIGLPAELGNEILGLVGLEFMKPGEAFKFMQDQFRNLGIKVDPLEGLTKEWGEQTVIGMAQLATLMAAAPTMAARTGSSVSDYVIREFGNTLQKFPGLAAVMEVGSAGGSVLARNVTGSDSTITSMAGALAGGAAAGGVVAGTKAAARGVVNLGNKALGRGPQLQANAVRDPGVDKSVARTFAQDQVIGEEMRMERALADAIESVPQTGNPAQVQARTRELIDRSERIANRIVGQFWDRVPMDAPVPMTPLRQGINVMRAEMAETPGQMPDPALLTRLYQLGQQDRGQGGRFVQNLPTVRRLRDERASIRRMRLEEEGRAKSGLPVNDGLVRNYNRLESLIDDTITRALPGDVTVQQARAMSIKYNDLFSRGSIADLMARRQRGDMAVPEGQTVEKLMNTYGGPQDLLDVRNTLVYQRAPGGKSFAVTQAERKELQQLVVEAENSIRSMFREAAAMGKDNGAMEAAAFIRKNEAVIKPLARVSGELEQVYGKLIGTMQEQKMFKQSALARFAQRDVDKALQSIWASKDPATEARSLMKTFQGDPDALEGLRAATVDHFLQRSKMDPLRMKEFMATPRLRSMLEEVMDPSQLKRMDKIVDVTARLQAGDEKLLRHMFKGPAMLFARVIGAQVGRQVAAFTGGGTVQTPGIVAQHMSRLTEKLMHTTSPKDMLGMAIMDPQWERMLLQRTPHTTKAARDQLKFMRRVIGATEGARQAAMEKLAKEDE